MKRYWNFAHILLALHLKLRTIIYWGDTPLNNPPIEIHANSSMFALVFWPNATIFWIFWLHECLKWRLELISNHFFDANLVKFSRYERLNSAITNFSWYTYLLTSSDHDIISMVYHPCMFVLIFFSKQTCNVEGLICHFHSNIKTLTELYFPRDAHIFRTFTIFYRQYRGCTKCGRI